MVVPKLPGASLSRTHWINGTAVSSTNKKCYHVPKIVQSMLFNSVFISRKDVDF